MIIVISSDTKFRLLCADIFAKDRHMIVSSADELMSSYALKSTDVVLLDLKYLPETPMNIFKCPVAAVSPVPTIEEAAQMLRLGIKGYGNRMMHPDNLKNMLRTLILGQLWMPPEILNKIIGMIPANTETDSNAHFGLSDREIEVAELVAAGKNNQEIADELDISLRTVKAHLTSVFSKTGLRDRLALAVSFKK